MSEARRPSGGSRAPRGPRVGAGRPDAAPRGRAPRREGDSPRGRSFDRAPRSGDAPRGRSFDHAPRSGDAPRGRSFDRAPRSGDAPRGRSFDRAPRSGDAPRGRSFDRAPRSGDAPRGRSFDRAPRSGDAPRGRSFDRAPRTFDRGPRREGDSRPPRTFDRGPRREGDSRPPRTFDRGPRREGDARPPRTFDRGPRREGDARPPRTFDRGPRREGDARPPRTFDRGPRREGDARPPRTFDRGPRREGDARPSRTFDRGPRREGDARPPRTFDRGPRREGDARPPRTFDRGPRREGDARPPRPFDRGPRREGDAPRRSFTPRGDDQAGAVNRSRMPYSEMPAPRTRWRRDGRPSPATPFRSPRGAEAPENGAHPPRTSARRPFAGPAEGPNSPLPSDPREAALRILHAVDTRGAFSDRLLDSAHARGGDPRDASLLHELVKGALRWRNRLDWALDQRVHIGLPAVQPWIRNILRLGAYQILMLDRIPMHAAVDESVKLAHKYGHPGAAGLVNSVLRRLSEERETLTWPEGDDVASLAVWGSHPEWLVERWLARFGLEDTRALLMANNRPVPTGLRVNGIKASREQLVAHLQREEVEARLAELSPDLVWVDGHHAPGALKAFRDGWCTAQDESESLVGRVVAPLKHERLLDLCAAPGGKSTHLAELIGDEGEVWAMERDAHRVASLEATITRLGVHAVHVVHGDGRTYAFPMPFDRVLVDAPCSGLGVLGRRADARWRKGPEVLVEMPEVQLELLDAASRRVVPGGLLVYSVCSFEPEETDHVIERFLATHPNFTRESVAGVAPDAVVTPEGTMRVLPHAHGCDGAFAARLRKA